MALLCSIARENTPEGVLSLFPKDPPEAIVASKPDSERGDGTEDDGLHGISCAEELAQRMACQKKFESPTMHAALFVNTETGVSPSFSNASGSSAGCYQS